MLLIFYVASHHHSEVAPLVEGMKVGDRLFLPAGVSKQAMSWEVIKHADDDFEVTLFNSGAGIQAHDKHPREERWIYYQKFRMTLQQIKDAHYFSYDQMVEDQISSHFFKGVTMNVTSMLDLDSVSSQKSGTCAAKSVLYLIKWFLSRPKGSLPKFADDDARYDWFKIWLLQDRFESVEKALLPAEPDLEFTEYEELAEYWTIPEDCVETCSFTYSEGLFKPLIRHAILRRVTVMGKHSLKHPEIAKSMREMLDSVASSLDDDPEFDACYACITKRP